MASDGAPASAARLARAASRCLAALVVAAPLLAAQSSAHAVTLRILPRVGDTLATRFEQDMDMTGTTRVRGIDTTMTMHASMLLLSRVLVQGRDESGTTVTAITDSVAVNTTGTRTPEQQRRAMEGQRVRLRISPNGSASVLEFPDALSPDVRAIISGMPATLPDEPMPVGGSWQRVTAIPVGGRDDPRSAATLRATYRLDSLSRDGAIAFISMRGTLSRDSTSRPVAGGWRVTSKGTITGSIRVDRRRGWWTDSRTAIVLRSTLTPVGAPSDRTMRVETRITQRMWTANGS